MEVTRSIFNVLINSLTFRFEFIFHIDLKLYRFDCYVFDSTTIPKDHIVFVLIDYFLDKRKYYDDENLENEYKIIIKIVDWSLFIINLKFTNKLIVCYIFLRWKIKLIVT